MPLGRLANICVALILILSPTLATPLPPLTPKPLSAPASFFDHFTGTALDPRWAALTSNGTLTVTDSFAQCVSPQAAAACAFYYNTKIDKTQSQLWAFAQSDHSNTFPQWWVTLVNSATAPTVGTLANWDPKLRVRIGTSLVSSTRGISVDYWNASHSRRQWRGSTNSWISGNTQASSPVNGDDYYITAIEIDGPGNRWRAMVWGKRSGTAGSYTFDQGLRLFSVTDWVSWSGMENTNDLWLMIGEPLNNANAGTLRTEWVRLDAGPKRDVWMNGKSSQGDSYVIKHGWGYEAANWGVEFIVPEDRTTIAINKGGSGAWDSGDVKDPFAFYDPENGTYTVLYAASNSSGAFQIGLASKTSPDGPLTQYAGNPIIPVGSGGESNVFAPALVKDVAEPDPNKRFKILYTGFDEDWRIYLATAPNITGPWTRQGLVIDKGPVGGFDQNGYSRPRPIFHNGMWYVFLSAKNSSEPGGPWRVSYATGTSLTNLAKSGIILVDVQSGPAQNITANIAGRTVRVGSTAGFAPDAFIEVDQDANQDNYGQSRIRKVVDGTTLELYHGLDGFTASAPAKIIQADGANRIEIADVLPAGARWQMHVTVFGFFTPYAGLGAHDENAGVLTADSLIGPYSWDHLATPPVTRGSWRNERSNENLSFVHLPVDTGPPLPDTTPPAISSVTAVNITTSAATITWSTDEAATSQVEYGTTISYGNSTGLDPTLVSAHSQQLTDLLPGTTYHYRVHSTDAAGNAGTSGDFTFTTQMPDVTPPVISGVTASNITSAAATITWSTDEPADTRVEYGTTAAYGSTTPLNPNLVTSHSQGLTGLAPNTLYHYRVHSADAAGNAAVSDDATFTTQTGPILLLATSLNDAASVSAPASGSGAGSAIVTTPTNDFVAAQVGNGIRIDAAGEQVRFLMLDGSVQNAELDRGTVDVWYRPNYNHTDGNRYAILSIGSWGVPGSLHVSKNNASNGNAFSFQFFDSAGGFYEANVASGAYGWSAGTWVHLKITWDFTVAPGVPNVRFYFNGVEAAASSTTGPFTLGPERTTDFIFIGNRETTGSLYANGVLDELKIYDRP